MGRRENRKFGTGLTKNTSPASENTSFSHNSGDMLLHAIENKENVLVNPPVLPTSTPADSDISYDPPPSEMSSDNHKSGENLDPIQILERSLDSETSDNLPQSWLSKSMIAAQNKPSEKENNENFDDIEAIIEDTIGINENENNIEDNKINENMKDRETKNEDIESIVEDTIGEGIEETDSQMKNLNILETLVDFSTAVQVSQNPQSPPKVPGTKQDESVDPNNGMEIESDQINESRPVIEKN
eukprot:UN23094